MLGFLSLTSKKLVGTEKEDLALKINFQNFGKLK
jgi:hypothetical protein